MLSVVVTRYGESDGTVKKCLLSLGKQGGMDIEVLFLDQKKSPAVKGIIKSINGKHITAKYINIPAISLSYARNYGLNIAATNYIAFCDADCILDKYWAYEIMQVFKKYKAAIVGTKIMPDWNSKTIFLHESKFIREFYSLLDYSQNITAIPKVVGASFAIDKKLAGHDAYFDENLGRRPELFIGGEETDLCARVKAKKGKIIYTPRAIAYHQISKERIRLGWIVKRVFYGGISRALRGGKAEPFNKTLTTLDKLSIFIIFPFYLLGYIKGLSMRT